MAISTMNISSKEPNGMGRGKALVADDERTNRLVLSAILSQLGYQVIEAENGLEAVELFRSEEPDIILMDIMMPVMDGYDAVVQIKSDPTSRFTPVIFLTGMTGEKDLAKCIEMGGDDFLTKPFNRTLLTAKIRSLERISLLHNQVNMLYARTQQDQAMAEEVFAGVVVTNNVALDTIKTLLKPAELFSGDILLTAYSPSGDLNVLMGDFTGHGLAAALGAIPASEVFRAMTGKGYSIQQILSGINSKLLGLLPTSMFLAVQFLTVSKSLDHVLVCNCGMPDVLFLDSNNYSIKHRTPSLGVPLGITSDIDFTECVELVKVNREDSVLLVSDGVTEAVNNNNEQFTRNRLDTAISERHPDESTIDSISRSLLNFCGDASQADDISLAEIPFTPNILGVVDHDLINELHHVEPVTDDSTSSTVDLTLTMHGERLSTTDPIPLILNHLNEMEGLGENRRLLFTVLTELYLNSLDHGVLGLDSSMKNENDGFTLYFTEREKRLDQLTDGFVTISISSHTTLNSGKMLIKVEDSGPGFDFTAYECNNHDCTRLSGRGIQILRELCSSIKYIEPGNQVEAVFCWNKN